MRPLNNGKYIERYLTVIDFTFKLNGKPISKLSGGAFSYNAFSGIGEHINKRISICIPSKGPIPVGTYYIFDRQSGGLLGPLRDWIQNKENWFALYAIDEKIDDETFCDKLKRGQFRLHPKGPAGISEGCITINNKKDYQTLWALLKNTKQQKVPGSELMAYGTVTVL